MCIGFYKNRTIPGVASTLMLQLHGAIYRPDFFVMMLRYCANLRAIRYESMNLNRIAADKSHRVIVALEIVQLFVCSRLLFEFFLPAQGGPNYKFFVYFKPQSFIYPL